MKTDPARFTGTRWRNMIFGLLFGVIIILMACGGGELTSHTPSGSDEPAELSGSVAVDGSSTVFPVTEAMAEEFGIKHRNVMVTVGVSGTGGFKKFCRNEIDISDASRPIKQNEIEMCAEHGVQYVELPVAFDGLSVMVHPKNDWVDKLTVEELKNIWEPASTVTNWSDVRSQWPDEKIYLVGADTDSGTFDYFTDAIVGEEGASRPDYVASSDDNYLVQAIMDEKYSLGYFGFAYYSENKDKLKLVPVDSGNGPPVEPSTQTINNGSYSPLSRPLLIYVNVDSLVEKPQVKEFVNFFLSEEGIPLVEEVGYVPLPETAYSLVRQRLEKKVVGSVFSGGSQPGLTIEQILKSGE